MEFYNINKLFPFIPVRRGLKGDKGDVGNGGIIAASNVSDIVSNENVFTEKYNVTINQSNKRLENDGNFFKAIVFVESNNLAAFTLIRFFIDGVNIFTQNIILSSGTLSGGTFNKFELYLIRTDSDKLYCSCEQSAASRNLNISHFANEVTIPSDLDNDEVDFSIELNNTAGQVTIKPIIITLFK
jgi:hypothetical protein